MEKAFKAKLKLCNNNNTFYKGIANVEEKFKIYTSCDAFILPTYHENFGNVILEALHSGLIVITTNKTPWSIIKENGCGLIIKPSSNSIIKSLNWLNNINQDNLKEMSEKAIITASYFDIRKYKSKILKIFK